LEEVLAFFKMNLIVHVFFVCLYREISLQLNETPSACAAFLFVQLYFPRISESVIDGVLDFLILGGGGGGGGSTFSFALGGMGGGWI